MELDLGLKITRTREDVSSSVDFRFSKDPFGPLVLSRETDSRFMIIIHLKGFKKEGIEIEINEEGNRITIRGRKPVEEMVLIRWMAWRKEVEFRVFKKVFLIPNIVDLDKIKARYDDDDSTLTITMPKRVNGISGFKIEEEEEEEERVDFGNVSEVEKIEEIQNGEGFEEEKVEREKSDEHSEKCKTEIHREVMEDRERESHVLGEKEETEDDYLEKTQQIDDQDKILEFVEEETISSKQELADSNKESEDSSLRKLPGIEGEDSHEKTRDDEQGNNHQEKLVSQGETKSGDFGSKAFKEIEKQEFDEQQDRTSKSGATDDDGDSLSNVQEWERRNENETNAEEFESDKLEPHEVDKIHDELVRKKEEEENAKVGEKNEDIKLQEETQEQHSKGQKRHGKEEMVITPEAETNIANDIRKPVKDIEVPEMDTLRKTCDEGKQKKKSVKMEMKNGDTVDAIIGEGFTPNIAETETKAAEFEVEKIHELVENEEQNAKVGTQMEDISLIKLQEIEEQFQGQKRHDKQEKIQELVEEKTPKAETNTANDTPKPAQVRYEGEHKNDQGEEYKEKITINDANAREVKEIIRQQDLDEPARFKEESKTQELVKSKTNEEEKGEKEIAETKKKDRPKVLEEKEKIQEVAEKKTKFARKDEEEEEIAEKKTEFCEDDDEDSSRKVGDSDEMKGQEEKDKIQELLLQEKVSDGGKGIIPKRIRESAREIEQKDSDVYEETGKEVQENRVAYQNEDEEEKKDGNDRPETISGRIEQVLVKEETKDCKEEEEKKDKDTEESKTKTSSDGVARKVQGTKEPKREHVNKIEERVKEKRGDHKKEIAELERESGLRKVQELYEPKECDKTRITEAEVPSLQEKKEEQPESYEKRYRIQQLVEAGDNDRKEEEKVIAKAEKENKTRIMEENEIVERRKKTEDGSFKIQEDEKNQELVKMKTSDYREKNKKQDGNDILTSQEAGRPYLDVFDRHDEQTNIPQLVEEEKMEKLEADKSGKFHEFEERKSYEDWIHDEREKRKDFVKEKATDPKDKHTGGQVHNDHKEEHQEDKVIIAKAKLKTEDDLSKKVEEIQKQEFDDLQKSMVQDKMQETDKVRAMEENEIMERVTKTKDGNLIRKAQEGEELGRHGKEETGKLDSGELERHCKQRKIQQQSVEQGKMEGDSSGKFQKKKSYEDWRQEEREEEATGDPKDKHTGVEEERFEKFAQARTKVEDEINEMLEKHKELDTLEGVLREGASDREKKEENLVDDFTTKIQETEKEESREADRHKKLDKTRNQEDEKPVMANNEKNSTRKLQLLKEHELKEPEEHKEQNKIFETNVPGVKEEDEERVAEKKIKEQETESYQDDNGEGKQRKIVDTKTDDRIVRKIQETKLQESNTRKDQEPEDKIEELEREKPMKKDDSFRQGQEFLENVSKKMKTGDDEEEAGAETEIKEGKSRKSELLAMQGLDEPEESEERKKIQRPMEEKTKIEEMQDKIHEPIVEITKHHSEEMKIIAEGVKSGKVEKIKSEKHHKPSEIQEKQNIQESVEEIIPKHREEERSEEGRYNAVLKEDSRKSQDVKEKIEEQFVVEERKKEKVDIDKRGKREQKERIPRLEAKTNDVDDSSRKSENEEEEESTRLRKQKKHQELVEIETSARRKEDKEEDVRKSKSGGGYDRSSKIQDNEEEKSDKLEKLGDHKEGTERNRAVWRERETKTRDDGCRKVKEIEELAITHKEQEKKQELVKKDTSKVKKDEETKNTNIISRTIKEDEKQDKNMGLVPEKKKNDCKNQDSGKVDKEVANANGSRKLKKIEEMESNQDNIQEFGEDNMINKEEEDNEIIMKEVEAKPKDHISKRPVRLKEQEKTRKPVQFSQTDNRQDEEIAKKETTTKESETRKKRENKEQETSEQTRLEEQETSEYMRLGEQERTHKLVEDRTSDIVEDGNSKKIHEIEKEESIEPGRYEKRNKIQEPVLDVETSENEEEEELEIEFEESEEDWEAEVIQEMDSNGDNDEIRQIKRIKVGFRLVGGSALFMSLIVIVISIIRSKKNIKCYKF